MTTFGLTKVEFESIMREIVNPLNQAGAEIYCFGSRARGDYQKNSDLDLMVVSDKPLAGEIGRVLESMQNSNFPFIVDLVQEQNFAEAYMANYLADRRLFKSGSSACSSMEK